jgi:very-short-patch-repair endonuclease
MNSLPLYKQNSLFPFWNLPKNKELETKAKKLRNAGVLSETLFWQAFKNKKLLGFDIDRQVIIDNYILDFFIPELGLAVEIDGESHDFKGNYDEERENYLKSLYIEVIRYKDIEIKKSMNFVVDSFQLAVKKRVEWLKQNPPLQDISKLKF